MSKNISKSILLAPLWINELSQVNVKICNHYSDYSKLYKHIDDFESVRISLKEVLKYMKDDYFWGSLKLPPEDKYAIPRL